MNAAPHYEQVLLGSATAIGPVVASAPSCLRARGHFRSVPMVCGRARIRRPIPRNCGLSEPMEITETREIREITE